MLVGTVCIHSLGLSERVYVQRRFVVSAPTTPIPTWANYRTNYEVDVTSSIDYDYYLRFAQEMRNRINDSLDAQWWNRASVLAQVVLPVQTGDILLDAGVE